MALYTAEAQPRIPEPLLTRSEVNIYSHALGSVLFAILPAHFYFTLYSQVEAAKPVDFFMVFVYFLGVAICFLFSAAYNHSFLGQYSEADMPPAAIWSTTTIRRSRVCASIWTYAASCSSCGRLVCHQYTSASSASRSTGISTGSWCVSHMLPAKPG